MFLVFFMIQLNIGDELMKIRILSILLIIIVFFTVGCNDNKNNYNKFENINKKDKLNKEIDSVKIIINEKEYIIDVLSCPAVLQLPGDPDRRRNGHASTHISGLYGSHCASQHRTIEFPYGQRHPPRQASVVRRRNGSRGQRTGVHNSFG